MWDFLANLAKLNQYEGEPSPEKSAPLSENLLRDLSWAVNDQLELTKLKDGSARLTKAALADQIARREGPGFESLMLLGYWLWHSEQEEIQAFPLARSGMLFVSAHYHVRFLDDFCDGKLVEIRDTEGFYAQPRSPRPGQIGFDCQHDGSVSEIPPDPQVVLRALAPRRTEVPDAKLSHVVFPNSGAPRVRERQQTASSCRDVYLHVHPDANTCEGVKYSYYELDGTCCDPKDCNYDADFALHRFLDALSLREMETVKKFVPPNGKLVVSGDVVDDPIELRRWTSGIQLKYFSQRAPGWAGSDRASCEDEVVNSARCHFGGGGTHFTVFMSRAPDGKNWYVTEMKGDMH